jgi:hypothetical protein
MAIDAGVAGRLRASKTERLTDTEFSNVATTSRVAVVLSPAVSVTVSVTMKRPG